MWRLVILTVLLARAPAAGAQPVLLDADVYQVLYGDLSKAMLLDLDALNHSDRLRDSGTTKHHYNISSVLDEIIQEADSLQETMVMKPLKSQRRFWNTIASGWRELFGMNALGWRGWRNPDDAWVGINKEEWYKTTVYELCLEYLLHARYKVYAVLRRRGAMRADKRYRLGYLLARLRRARYDELKLVNTARLMDERDIWQNLQAFLRMYQRVLRLHVDVRDAIALVHAVHAERDHWLYSTKT